MLIKYFHIRTETNEELKIEDISCIVIGRLPLDHKGDIWNDDANKYIDICSSKGRMVFKLSEIIDLDFCIVDEEKKYCIPIRSLEKSKLEDEENGTI